MLKEVYKYREYILSAIWIDFYSQYKRSKLGILWMVIHPFVQVAIYTLVLSAIMQIKLPGIDNQSSYSIYLISGMLCWFLFSDIVSRMLSVFVDNGNIIKKMNFPRIILPVVVLGRSFVNFLIMYFSMLIIFVIMGHNSIHHFIWMPILAVTTILFSFGLGLLLGVVNIFIRDIAQITIVVLQLLFWLTPIVYSLQMLPEAYHGFFVLNPVALIVQEYQNVFAYNILPNFDLLMIFTVLSLILIYCATFIFKKAEGKMVDVL